MRKIFVMVMASLAISATAALAQAPAAAPTKVGYINSQIILTNAPGAAEARTTIQKETEKHRADLALSDDSIKNMIQSFQQKQLAMSKEARDKQEADIRARQQALQQRADQLEQQMEQRQADLIKPIMDKVNAALADIRKEGGYALILDTATGAVVAADPGLDLTDQVLAKLKANAPTAATAPKKP